MTTPILPVPGYTNPVTIILNKLDCLLERTRKISFEVSNIEVTCDCEGGGGCDLSEVTTLLNQIQDSIDNIGESEEVDLSEIIEMLNTIQTLISQLEAEQCDCDAIQDALNTIQTTLEGLDISSDLTDITNQISALSTAINGVQSSVDSLPLPVDLTPVTTQLNTIESSLESIQNSISNLEVEVDLSAITDQLNSIESQLCDCEALTGSLSTISTNTQNILDQVGTATGEITTLFGLAETTVNDLTEALLDLQIIIGDQSGSSGYIGLEQVNQKLDELMSRLCANLCETVFNIQSSVSQLSSTLDSNNTTTQGKLDQIISLLGNTSLSDIVDSINSLTTAINNNTTLLNDIKTNTDILPGIETTLETISGSIGGGSNPIDITELTALVKGISNDVDDIKDKTYTVYDKSHEAVDKIVAAHDLVSTVDLKVDSINIPDPIDLEDVYVEINKVETKVDKCLTDISGVKSDTGILRIQIQNISVDTQQLVTNTNNIETKVDAIDCSNGGGSTGDLTSVNNKLDEMRGTLGAVNDNVNQTKTMVQQVKAKTDTL